MRGPRGPGVERLVADSPRWGGTPLGSWSVAVCCGGGNGGGGGRLRQPQDRQSPRPLLHPREQPTSSSGPLAARWWGLLTGNAHVCGGALASLGGKHRLWPYERARLGATVDRGVPPREVTRWVCLPTRVGPSRPETGKHPHDPRPPPPVGSQGGANGKPGSASVMKAWYIGMSAEPWRSSQGPQIQSQIHTPPPPTPYLPRSPPCLHLHAPAHPPLARIKRPAPTQRVFCDPEEQAARTNVGSNPPAQNGPLPSYLGGLAANQQGDGRLHGRWGLCTPTHPMEWTP